MSQKFNKIFLGSIAEESALFTDFLVVEALIFEALVKSCSSLLMASSADWFAGIIKETKLVPLLRSVRLKL